MVFLKEIVYLLGTADSRMYATMAQLEVFFTSVSREPFFLFHHSAFI